MTAEKVQEALIQMLHEAKQEDGQWLRPSTPLMQALGDKFNDTDLEMVLIALEIVTKRLIPNDLIQHPQMTIEKFSAEVARLPANEEPLFPLRRVWALAQVLEAAYSDSKSGTPDSGQDAES